MRKKPILCLALFFMIMILSFTALPSAAATADFSRVGVKIGDTAEYSSAATNSSIFKVNRSTLMVTNVAGTVVTMNVTGYNPDGSKNNTTIITGNVSKGESFVSAYLIPANLSAHDPIYDGAPLNINETITMTIAGTPRTVNHLNLTIMYDGSIFLSENVYWDRASGLTAVARVYVGDLGWVNTTLTSTSLWGGGGGNDGDLPSGLSTSTLLIIGAVISVIVIVTMTIVLRGRRKEQVETIGLQDVGDVGS